MQIIPRIIIYYMIRYWTKWKLITLKKKILIIIIIIVRYLHYHQQLLIHRIKWLHLHLDNLRFPIIYQINLISNQLPIHSNRFPNNKKKVFILLLLYKIHLLLIFFQQFLPINFHTLLAFFSQKTSNHNLSQNM